MVVRVRCPNPACGKTANVAAQYVGWQARCRRCGRSFTVTTDVDEVGPLSPSGRHLPPRIGRFVIRARLGAGPHGTVYRADDPQLGRPVALKVPRPGTFDTMRELGRFLHEAAAAGKLLHPNIVPVYGAGRSRDNFYIASAFVEGTTLAQLLRDRPPDRRTAVALVRDLADALAYAHAEGVLHRDIKPANIMLVDKPPADVPDDEDRPWNPRSVGIVPRLMDFGLVYHHEFTRKLTRDGEELGTPCYMAPEQVGPDHDAAQPASDQYSLGVVLYELLCGRVPFDGPLAAVVHHHLHVPPPPPRALRPDVPELLERVCLRTLSKSPSHRYPSCGDFARALDRWLDGAPATHPAN
jgi:serine/threonine protein kinase